MTAATWIVEHDSKWHMSVIFSRLKARGESASSINGAIPPIDGFLTMLRTRMIHLLNKGQ